MTDTRESFETGDPYTDEVLSSIDCYQYERDSECGRGLAEHILSADPLGHVHEWCTKGEDSSEFNPDWRPTPDEDAADSRYIKAAEATVRKMWDFGCRICGFCSMQDHVLKQGSDGAPAILCERTPASGVILSEEGTPGYVTVLDGNHRLIQAHMRREDAILQYDLR
jgi:hypothetical protein